MDSSLGCHHVYKLLKNMSYSNKPFKSAWMDVQTCLVIDISLMELILLIMKHNYHNKFLENQSFGCEDIAVCTVFLNIAVVPLDWPIEAYSLIGRDDIVATLNLPPTHVSPRDRSWIGRGVAYTPPGAERDLRSPHETPDARAPSAKHQKLHRWRDWSNAAGLVDHIHWGRHRYNEHYE